MVKVKNQYKITEIGEKIFIEGHCNRYKDAERLKTSNISVDRPFDRTIYIVME
jgi:hypothetical protein